MICKCENPEPKLMKDIKSNGSIVVYELCSVCKGYTDIIDDDGRIHRKQYKHSDISVPLEEIETGKNYMNKICDVCGSSDRVEEHHFIPKSLIDIPKLKINPKWKNYTKPLCYSCHYSDFHRIMTFFMYTFYSKKVADIMKDKYKSDKVSVLKRKS
jgi:hypothetical protein